MGQKVHPIGLRLGIIKTWDSRWYARKDYKNFVLEDEAIRRYFRERFARGADGGGRGRSRERSRDAGVSRLEIERAANNLRLTLHTAKPGIIIGRGGKGVDDLRAEIEQLTGKKVHIDVVEVRQAEQDAQLVAEAIASQIERRVAFKRAIRQAIARTMKAGGKGIKVLVAGRLGGSEMARRYPDKDGKIPLHTLRADIDYGFTEARTMSGHIGIKVWIYRGDVLPEPKAPPTPAEAPAKRAEPKERKGWRRAPKPPEAKIFEGQPAAAPEGEGAPAEPSAEAAPAGEAAPAADAAPPVEPAPAEQAAPAETPEAPAAEPRQDESPC
jgi:small subunit ribosomal protein S3